MSARAAPATRGLPATACLGLLVTAVVIVAVLGVRYHGASVAGRFDATVGGWMVAASARAGSAASRVSMLGAAPVVAVAALVAAAVLVWRRRAPGASAFVVLVPLVTTVTVEWLLKPWVGRTLEGDLSFPSGHTSRVTAFVVALVLAVRSTGAGRGALRLIGGVGLAVITMVAWSLVAAGDHYATDVLAGLLVGSVIAVAGGELTAVIVRAAKTTRSG